MSPSSVTQGNFAVFGEGHAIVDGGVGPQTYTTPSQVDESIKSSAEEIWKAITGEDAIAAYKADTWSSGVSYTQGSYCQYDDVGYKCLESHTAGEHFDESKWRLAITKNGKNAITTLMSVALKDGDASLLDLAPSYNGNKRYFVNQLAIKEGLLQICTSAGKGPAATFSSDSATIENSLLLRVERLLSVFASKYSETAQYSVGQLVLKENDFHEPVVQICTVGGIGPDAAFSEANATVEKSLFESIKNINLPTAVSELTNDKHYLTGDAIVKAYDTSRFGYKVGATCSYNGQFYLCTADVSAGDTFDASKWEQKTFNELVPTDTGQSTISWDNIQDKPTIPNVVALEDAKSGSAADSLSVKEKLDSIVIPDYLDYLGYNIEYLSQITGGSDYHEYKLLNHTVNVIKEEYFDDKGIKLRMPDSPGSSISRDFYVVINCTSQNTSIIVDITPASLTNAAGNSISNIVVPSGNDVTFRLTEKENTGKVFLVTGYGAALANLSDLAPAYLSDKTYEENALVIKDGKLQICANSENKTFVDATVYDALEKQTRYIRDALLPQYLLKNSLDRTLKNQGEPADAKAVGDRINSQYVVLYNDLAKDLHLEIRDPYDADVTQYAGYAADALAVREYLDDLAEGIPDVTSDIWSPSSSGKAADAEAVGTQLSNLKDKISTVQSDWNEKDDTAVSYIKNKPTIPAAATIDTSLNVSGAAADSKTVGAKIEEINGLVVKKANGINDSINKIDTSITSVYALKTYKSNEYDSSVTYSIGDCVLYNGQGYRCLIDNTNLNPTDASAWHLELTKDGITNIDNLLSGVKISTDGLAKLTNLISTTFDVSTSYSVGDVVIKDDKLQKCTVAGLGSSATFKDTTVYDIIKDKIENIDIPDITVDKTLSIQGEAADAKTTGDKISALRGVSCNQECLYAFENCINGGYEWEANYEYIAGDFVSCNNVVYKCNETHMSSDTFDDSKWDIILSKDGRKQITTFVDSVRSGLSIESNLASSFNVTKQYGKGDVVVKDGKLNVCTSAGNGDTAKFNVTNVAELIPKDISDLTDIDKIVFDKAIDEEYSPTKSYSNGDTCSYNGEFYLCKEDITYSEEAGENAWDESKWTKQTFKQLLTGKIPSLVVVDSTLTKSGEAADSKVVGDKISALENSSKIAIDTTLTVSDQAADSKTVGDKFTSVDSAISSNKERIDQIENALNLILNVTTGTLVKTKAVYLTDENGNQHSVEIHYDDENYEYTLMIDQDTSMVDEENGTVVPKLYLLDEFSNAHLVSIVTDEETGEKILSIKQDYENISTSISPLNLYLYEYHNMASEPGWVGGVRNPSICWCKVSIVTDITGEKNIKVEAPVKLD